MITIYDVKSSYERGWTWLSSQNALSFVQHWEHLCECKSKRRRLLYRHSLAELHELVLEMDKHCYEDTTQSRTIRRETSFPDEPTALTKKVGFFYLD